MLREGHGEFMIEQLTLEPPRPDGVLDRLVATGMCHTDLMVRTRLLPTPLPAVLGHEGAGAITAVGSAVRVSRPAIMWF